MTPTDYAAAIAKTLEAYPKGWGLDLVARLEPEGDGVAFVGALDEGDLYAYIEVDTGNYSDPDAALPIAEFIAACHPAALRSLLDEREKRTGEVERMRKDAAKQAVTARLLPVLMDCLDNHQYNSAAEIAHQLQRELTAIDAALKDTK